MEMLGGKVYDKYSLIFYSSLDLLKLYPQVTRYLISNMEKMDTGVVYEVCGIPFFIIRKNKLALEDAYQKPLPAEIISRLRELIANDSGQNYKELGGM